MFMRERVDEFSSLIVRNSLYIGHRGDTIVDKNRRENPLGKL